MNIRPYFFAARQGTPPPPSDLPTMALPSERYRLLLEHSIDVIVEANRQGEIVYVSTNVRAILGYTPGELIGTSIFTHVHPDNLTRARLQFALPDGRGTCRFRHRNGSWRWVEAVSREFTDPRGQPRSVLIVRDVTQRVEADAVRQNLEEELNRTSKLGALGLMAGEIAHDFNNLLTVINVHLSLAQMDTQDPRIEESLAQVEQAVGQAKQLARQILQFSRKQDTEHQLVRLPTLVTEVLQLLQPTWSPSIEIVTDLPADGGWIMGSPNQLHQVLTNLFVNAAQAMKGSPGRLEVRVEPLTIEQAYADPVHGLAAGRYLQLTVTDTGHGMDAATQKRVFEPFFTTKGHGSGLGLAVVQRVVKEHGASIRVSSEPGRGTTFRIFFTALSGPMPAPRSA
jgi:PAS domain S-box-containing protein